jgi:S1-C subfamily serine protease
MRKQLTNSSFQVFAGAVALGVIVGFAVAAPFAEANLLKDLWDRFLGTPAPSLAPGAASPQAGKPPVPLYKPVIEYERAVIEAVQRASPAVVSITVSKNVPIIEQCPYNPFPDLPPEFRQFFGEPFQFYAPCEKGSRLEEVGGGSGFIISPDGLIVTNKHVVLDKSASYTAFTNDGKKYEAEVLARDPVQDLAVLKIKAQKLPTVTLGDSQAIELGQSVIAIGNALGEFRNTVSVGVISGLSRNVTAGGAGIVEEIRGVIQTDAAINPGNSGGPLLNLRGEVIGINTAIAAGAENIGFAIPINDAKRAIESVKRTGEIQSPYLGVRYLIITPEVAEQQKLPVEYGALLRGTGEGPAVEPASPAARAGLKAEDIILEVNGKRIDQDNPLGNLIGRLSVGQTVTLTVHRGGETLTLRATLGKRPSS